MSSLTERRHIRQYLLLRTIIAALGERVTPPWWRTQFLTDFGLRTIARVFPRTPSMVNGIAFKARQADRLAFFEQRLPIERNIVRTGSFEDMLRWCHSATQSNENCNAGKPNYTDKWSCIGKRYGVNRG